MKDIIIEGESGEYDVPEVRFLADRNVCTIMGKSFLEDTVGFYAPLMEWLEHYIEIYTQLVFNIKLEYYNTSTSKLLYEIVGILSEFRDFGGKVKINWYIDHEDEDAEDEIRMAEENFNISINILKIRDLGKHLDEN